MKQVFCYIDRNIYLQGPAFALTEVNAKNLIGFNGSRKRSEAPFMCLSGGNTRRTFVTIIPSLFYHLSWLFLLPHISREENFKILSQI